MGKEIQVEENKTDIHKILKEYWGYDKFRELQENIITSIIEGKDTLGLMPTGGGKSITFQVPALAMQGTCLVITPLIALMKDQVQNIKDKGIRAAAIYSGMTYQDIQREMDNCILGNYKFLYVSPERLSTPLFLSKIKQLNINLIAVDESHCISQWGYDFRPSYLRIAEIRQIIPDAPILALTATATPDVVEDIQNKLCFNPDKQVFRKSFLRKNLAYVVKYSDDKERMMLKILNSVPGSSVVYVRNRKRTKEIAELLTQNGISADFYHAGINNEEKDERQNSWKSGDCRVIVATNAFGMGIDKPDVRTVIHLDLPDSLEAYFQEAGRAGRDGEKAYAVLIYSNSDKTKLKKRISDNYPDKEFIKNVYNSLCYYYQICVGETMEKPSPFDIGKFCSIYKYSITQTASALKLLQQDGYIELDDEPENSSRVIFSIERDELYDINTTEEEDIVLKALMRNYSGLFSDYVYIDESLIARKSEKTKDEVYRILTTLRQNGVINYIPMKKEPRIMFVRGRVESERFCISKSVYNVRKDIFEHRISCAIDYAENKYTCRSKLLLKYFGEELSQDCGCCDNCLNRNMENSVNYNETTEELKNMIFVFLKSVSTGPTPIQLIETFQSYNSELIKSTLKELMADGIVKLDPEGRLKTNK